MGLIRKKVVRRVVCNHRDAFGDRCHKCGAENQFGLGFETRLITVEQLFLEVCTHSGEFGSHCSKCGDKLSNYQMAPAGLPVGAGR